MLILVEWDSKEAFDSYCNDPRLADLHPHRVNGAADYIWHLFDRLDVDKDGYLTLDEFNSISSLRRDGSGGAATKQGGSLGNPSREPAGSMSDAPPQ